MPHCAAPRDRAPNRVCRGLIAMYHPHKFEVQNCLSDAIACRHAITHHPAVSPGYVRRTPFPRRSRGAARCRAVPRFGALWSGSEPQPRLSGFHGSWKLGSLEKQKSIIFATRTFFKSLVLRMDFLCVFTCSPNTQTYFHARSHATAHRYPLDGHPLTAASCPS